jgi:hypothetical protein
MANASLRLQSFNARQGSMFTTTRIDWNAQVAQMDVKTVLQITLVTMMSHASLVNQGILLILIILYVNLNAKLELTIALIRMHVLNVTLVVTLAIYQVTIQRSANNVTLDIH